MTIYNATMLSFSCHSDKSVVRTVIAVLGKGCSATSFGTVILYSSELYPTVVRYVKCLTQPSGQ